MQNQNIEMPMGLGMAMCMNQKAMDNYSHLSTAQKQQIINQAHSVHSKHEMQELVNHIANNQQM
ncbi:MAG: hypothetical protein ACI4RN_08315 [Oscillospiraceae bacterium]